VERLKVKALSSSPNTAKKKKKISFPPVLVSQVLNVVWRAVGPGSDNMHSSDSLLYQMTREKQRQEKDKQKFVDMYICGCIHKRYSGNE
jgi:hypothetical protein